MYRTNLVVNVDSTCGSVVDGAVEDDGVSFILHLYTCYPVMVDVVLLQYALGIKQQQDERHGVMYVHVQIL